MGLVVPATFDFLTRQKSGEGNKTFFFLNVTIEVAIEAARFLLCIGALNLALAESPGNSPTDPTSVIAAICPIN